MNAPALADPQERMLWTPPAGFFADPTIVFVEDRYHLFYEETPFAADAKLSGTRFVAHWISEDMFSWKPLPAAIACGPSGSFDAGSIYHMDVYVHEGVWHMFYTGLDKTGPGEQQSIGLATSKEGIVWEKHPANPVLRADPRWYESAIPREATYQEKDFGRLWFRDPCILRNPKTGKFGMVVIARDKAQHPDRRGCLAWALSDDLVRWEARPPIYSPGRFHTIETPSIFERNGRHYLVYMSHPLWGPPVLTSDPYQCAGDFYAISRHGWEGPYVPPEDEILVGSASLRLGAARTVVGRGGETFLYSWLLMQPGPTDEPVKPRYPLVFPPPKRVRFTDEGLMQATSYEKVETLTRGASVSETQASPSDPARWRREEGLIGKRLQGREMALFPEARRDFIFSARVSFLQGERAGFVARADEGGRRGWCIVADRRFGKIAFGALDEQKLLDARKWIPRENVDLKIVAYGPSLEVYVDDRLMIHTVRYRETNGRLGFFVENAEARFREPCLKTFRAEV